MSRPVKAPPNGGDEDSPPGGCGCGGFVVVCEQTKYIQIPQRAHMHRRNHAAESVFAYWSEKMFIDEIRQTIINRREKRRNDQVIRFNKVHKRSISILQKRYGYTREQATSQRIKHYSKAWLG